MRRQGFSSHIAQFYLSHNVKQSQVIKPFPFDFWRDKSVCTQRVSFSWKGKSTRAKCLFEQHKLKSMLSFSKMISANSLHCLGYFTIKYSIYTSFLFFSSLICLTMTIICFGNLNFGCLWLPSIALAFIVIKDLAFHNLRELECT